MKGGMTRRPPIVIATIAPKLPTASSFSPGLTAAPKSFRSEFRISYQKM
jgi:hypothetical protein